MHQWMLKITAYADRLLEGLDHLDWPEKIKTMQRNWIGRSEGAVVEFRAVDRQGAERPLPVFTTRPDTLFGATYMVIAPEHPMVADLVASDRMPEVEAYAARVRKEAEIDRTAATRERSGVFLGALAVNPVNGEKIPIWVSDYILMGYGTGASWPSRRMTNAITSSPSNLGSRFEKSSLPTPASKAHAYTGEGSMVHSGRFSGMRSEEGREAVVRWLESRGVGKSSVNYKLRDWGLFPPAVLGRANPDCSLRAVRPGGHRRARPAARAPAGRALPAYRYRRVAIGGNRRMGEYLLSPVQGPWTP